MNKPDIIEHVFEKRIQNYTFGIVFFLIFSFFVIFAIRPNLLALVTLQEQLTQLRSIEKKYEDAITQIISLQTLVEQNRDNFYLLDESLPNLPKVNKIIDDIKKNASESGITVAKIDVSNISLKENKTLNQTKTFEVNIEGDADFAQAKQFIDTLIKQRRLKTIKNLGIIKEGVSSESATLTIQLEIDGYYL